jgi:hypothetical protein
VTVCEEHRLMYDCVVLIDSDAGRCVACEMSEEILELENDLRELEDLRALEAIYHE